MHENLTDREKLVAAVAALKTVLRETDSIRYENFSSKSASIRNVADTTLRQIGEL